MQPDAVGFRPSEGIRQEPQALTEAARVTLTKNQSKAEVKQ